MRAASKPQKNVGRVPRPGMGGAFFPINRKSLRMRGIRGQSAMAAVRAQLAESHAAYLAEQDQEPAGD